MLCSLHVHKALHCGSSLLAKMLLYSIYYFEAFRDFAVSRSSKFSLREFFIYKNATRVDYYAAALRFYLSLFSTSFTLCKCLQKTSDQKNNQSTQLWVATHRLRTAAVEYKQKYLNRQHISIRKKSLLYSIYDGVTRKSLISNVGIESVG